MYMDVETAGQVNQSLPAMANPAVARCCKAWKKTYQTTLQKQSAVGASRVAAQAFRTALPALSSRENCRDFIACVAQGLLLGAISETESTKLIYAVQTALSAFPKEEKSKPSTSHLTIDNCSVPSP